MLDPDEKKIMDLYHDAKKKNKREELNKLVNSVIQRKEGALVAKVNTPFVKELITYKEKKFDVCQNVGSLGLAAPYSSPCSINNDIPQH